MSNDIFSPEAQIRRRKATIAANKKAEARRLAAAARRSERQAQADAITMSESLTVHADVSNPGSSIKFCQCNEGFSGHQAAERLAAHIASPNPNSTSALLIKAMA